MSWEWILSVWTVLGVAWWIVAFLLVAAAKPRAGGSREEDPRRLTIFKPLAPQEPREFSHIRECLETFVADLDDRSELLIGCHEPDGEMLRTFVAEMREKYPRADVKLVIHPDPNGYANPKISWMRILARHSSGELWFWSDSDMKAPPGTIRSLRSDLARTEATFLTSPYVIQEGGTSPELLDTLFVNVEFYPGAILLGHLNLVRFGFGSGMLFEAADFRERIDWATLGSSLAEDFHLGRLLAPARLGSVRLTTAPASGDWKGAVLHYLRWQKTIRWCRPGSYAAQLMVLPILGWLGWVAANPAGASGWLGLFAVLFIDTVAALSICRLLRCPVEWRRLHAVPVWSILRGLTWIACWLPWPIVWRGQKWWSPFRKSSPEASAATSGEPIGGMARQAAYVLSTRDTGTMVRERPNRSVGSRGQGVGAMSRSSR